MGQYHILVNLTRKEFVNPHGMGFGAKQLEHINGMGRILYLLTMVPARRGGGDILNDGIKTFFLGRWLGDKVAIVGDYSCDEDLPSFPNFGSIYKSCTANSNPLYNTYGFGIKNSKRSSLWMDITADLAFEVEDLLGQKVIPYDHPTLWSDGTPKPQSTTDNAKKAKAVYNSFELKE